MWDRADSAFVSAYRKHHETGFDIEIDYLGAPAMEGCALVLIDPMLATGASLQAAYDAMDQADAWSYEAQAKEILGKLGLHETDRFRFRRGYRHRRINLTLLFGDRGDGPGAAAAAAAAAGAARVEVCADGRTCAAPPLGAAQRAELARRRPAVLACVRTWRAREDPRRRRRKRRRTPW